MTQLWLHESDEKKKRLLEAALKEFSEKGYELASTNQIVKQANLSKGMLFHLFQNKKSLFLYIAECCIQFLLNYLEKYRSTIARDPFQRILELNQLKMNLFALEPAIYSMSLVGFIDRPNELKEEIQNLEQQLNHQLFEFYFSDIDTSELRTDISYRNVLMLFFESVEAMIRIHVIKNKSSVDQGKSSLFTLFEGLNDYIEALKYGLYQSKNECS